MVGTNELIDCMLTEAFSMDIRFIWGDTFIRGSGVSAVGRPARSLEWRMQLLLLVWMLMLLELAVLHVGEIVGFATVTVSGVNAVAAAIFVVAVAVVVVAVLVGGRWLRVVAVVCCMFAVLIGEW